MHGFGSHTFSLINAAGERHWVKFHFRTQQGIENLTDDEAAAAIAQRVVEVAQALEQELRPRPGGVAAAEQAIVEAEDRDHAVALHGGAQRDVVDDPQVAPVPEERGHAGWRAIPISCGA